ncbi:sulfite exporter TauE/SafE family protein [Siccirubricoccus sp. KC 17139]|uniref:Sulfite exporter TauE/SafE family protein n=1 Tax=Siccirubricoccus soli TaxID=2899147 RepID=A0ABT1D7P8_9PROT|nr:sulfite exporter TauE/SafE family protein [Siccirubricoccus soli]MCO6417904.1 sulfite exporter TauE/SafE family protein [Siccirubricoccus soli]MCP2684039.1 sulfite exporter TauE/SafE family protein [Siccirubricoccus soli]
MFADCLHALAAIGGKAYPALFAAMLLAGLAGGVGHCAGMCGPFVMAQIATGGGLEGGALRRLSGALLLPYQAGRATGYALLGGIAGGAGQAVAEWAPHGLLALPLGLAAASMLAQGAARLPALAPLVPKLPVPALPLGAAGRLLAGPPGPLRGYALGLLLSALPCGLLYGALAGAAGSGGALAGALAMLGFVLGTMPTLAGTALLGRFFARRFGARLATPAALLLLLNGALLAALALRSLA